jgi:hypothetical protein
MVKALQNINVAQRREVFEPIAQYMGVHDTEMEGEFQRVLSAMPLPKCVVEFPVVSLHRLSCSTQARLWTWIDFQWK